MLEALVDLDTLIEIDASSGGDRIVPLDRALDYLAARMGLRFTPEVSCPLPFAQAIARLVERTGAPIGEVSGWFYDREFGVDLRARRS